MKPYEQEIYSFIYKDIAAANSELEFPYRGIENMVFPPLCFITAKIRSSFIEEQQFPYRGIKGQQTECFTCFLVQGKKKEIEKIRS